MVDFRAGCLVTFYMNCAPITVLPAAESSSTGRRQRRAAGQRRREEKMEEDQAAVAGLASFPEMFMANMGAVSGNCTTDEALREQIAISYPDPGASVVRPDGDEKLFKQPCDGNPRARAAQASGASGSDSGATTSSAGADAPRTSSVEATGRASSASSTSSSSTSSSSTSSSTSSTSSSSTTLATSTTSDASPPKTTSSGTCIEGHLTCLSDGTHFATCTGGKLTAAQPIAPGYKCRPGSGVGLDISPA
ncbi:hypothetical protein GGR56DRAFT_616876 [Xylariaceae sp. FL0804]|nr:hypothetical protein GGR56DRAFT_616876 [Xylariaceae sp. FL0804]